MKQPRSHSKRSLSHTFLRLLMLPTSLISFYFIFSYYHAHLQNPMLANSIYPYLAQELFYSFFLLTVSACFLDLLEKSMSRNSTDG